MTFVILFEIYFLICYNLSFQNLIFISESNCLVYMRRGLSTGSVLVILLLVFSGIYFASGALALKYFRGAVGLELIPNYEFWSDLPGLVRVSIVLSLLILCKKKNLV